MTRRRLPAWCRDEYGGYGEPVTTYTTTDPEGESHEVTNADVAKSLARGGWTVTAVTEGRV